MITSLTEENLNDIKYKTIKFKTKEGNLYTTFEMDLNTGIMFFESRSQSFSKRKEILEYLYSQLGKEEHKKLLIGSGRAELNFINELQEALNHIEVSNIKQYPVLNNKYKIDLYIPYYKLAVEFDEKYHKSSNQSSKDTKRSKEIKDTLNCSIIRVSEEDSVGKNISIVLKAIYEV